ncbi:acyl-coenzyme A thioesterase 13-like [Panicum miliaceum]|uniref:Acyl-coenzyme A thioesterase 13-like n=1 Tax=Panicum miliaceum TaxID=4540 RepID=A0A3L6SJM5_PANMI|nr:acyl-coenzyme A thioesterase 13-like [Panicum miliaceum]
MGDEARARRLTAIARKWLVDPRVGYSVDLNPAAGDGERQELSAMAMAGARVSLAEPGRVVCSLRVRAPLTDAEGNWHAGAIAAAVDNMSAAVVFTVDGAPTVTVQYSLSYFSPAHPDATALPSRCRGSIYGGGGTESGARKEPRLRIGGESRIWIAGTQGDGVSGGYRRQRRHGGCSGSAPKCLQTAPWFNYK